MLHWRAVELAGYFQETGAGHHHEQPGKPDPPCPPPALAQRPHPGRRARQAPGGLAANLGALPVHDPVFRPGAA
ncbi:hypothetical protein LP420_06175 [Massilia sp. B-10]|nr:hypothetical protein LP420_06175 [Massilia sp. B-10]